ncbi:MAG: hypothetical protein D6690_02985 [Nitrospirae bacterium]|nr:MAG: hypothetical protein D6690_02985 [Nitrospirota bacterium]
MQKTNQGCVQCLIKICAGRPMEFEGGNYRYHRISEHLRGCSSMRNRRLIHPWSLYLACGLIFPFVAFQQGLAFVGEPPLLLVSHRDANGNLVWPKKTRQSSVGQQTDIPTSDSPVLPEKEIWEMSTAEVKAQESAPFVWEVQAPVLDQGERRLGYTTSIEGHPALLTYELIHDRLREMTYLFEIPLSEEAMPPVLQEYHTIKRWIMQSYGEPTNEEYLWLDSLYRDAPELWDTAVLRGHLTIVAEWRANGTSITLLLNGDGDGMGLLATFARMQAPSPTHLVGLPFHLFGL